MTAQVEVPGGLVVPAESSHRGAIAGFLDDLKWNYQQWVVNSVAGSRLVPRILRRAIYSLMGVKIKALTVYAGVHITGGRNLTIERGTFVNHGCRFEAAGGISVGADCAFGPEAIVLTSTHRIDGIVWDHAQSTQSVAIGDRCWIGARAMILPGVTVVDDCVIAAGAVVASDCDRPGIWAGVPAKLIRS